MHVKLPKKVDTTHCKNILLGIASKVTTLVTGVGKREHYQNTTRMAMTWIPQGKRNHVRPGQSRRGTVIKS